MADETPVFIDNSDLPLHRVAMVVFTAVRAVDCRDARHIVESTIRNVVHEACGQTSHGELEFRAQAGDSRPWRVPVQVHDVSEVSCAFREGKLTATPIVRRDG